MSLDAFSRMWDATVFQPPTKRQQRAAWLNERSQGIRAELLHPVFPRDMALPVDGEDWEE